jgi:hypothetical protein
MAFFVSSSAILLSVVVAASATPPHIIMHLVDDWGHNNIGFRNPEIVTPNLDSLVADGVIFDRFYTHVGALQWLPAYEVIG